MNNYPPLKLKTIPYAHQAEATTLSWDREFFALLMEMGTGKSKVFIDTVAGLAKTNKINGVLILAPKGVYLNWVKDEIPIHMPEEIDYYIAPWKSSMNSVEQKTLDGVLRPSVDAIDILVMNIEALVSERAFDVAAEFLQNHRAITMIDESTSIKNPQAVRSKRCHTLGKMSKYRRIATGTPITQGPLDIFSQFQFLSPGSLGFTSFTAFRAYYANMITVRLGTRSFPKIEGYRNLDVLQRDMGKHSYRKLKSECLDLPEKVYSTRYVQMTPEQRKIYDQMREEAVLQFSDMSIVTSTSALTTIMRLQQIACGHVKDDLGNVVAIPNNRMEALDEIIEEVDGKIIIWCNYREDVERVHKHLYTRFIEGVEEYPVHYYGGTSDEARATAIQNFRNDPKCRFFIGTPATGGKGITLVESHTTIYFSNGYNLEQRLQSEDRNHRIGQKNTVTIIDIACEGTVDERITKALKAKKNLADSILDSLPDLLAIV